MQPAPVPAPAPASYAYAPHPMGYSPALQCSACTSPQMPGDRWCSICHTFLPHAAVGKLASPGRRIVAYLLDYWVAGFVAMMGFFGLVLRILDVPMAITLFFTLVSVSYFAWALFCFTRGTSPGKSLLGMHVVKDDGSRAGILTMILREWIGKFVSSLIFSLGFFWIFLDKANQGWHDKIARTYVVTGGADPGINYRALVQRAHAPQPALEVVPAPALRSAPEIAAVAELPPVVEPSAASLPAAAPARSPFAPKSAAPAAPSAPSAPSAPVTLPPSEIDDSTCIVTRRAATPTYALTCANGAHVEITTTTIVGRDPDANAAPGAAIAAIDDPQRTVSKTHALLRIHDDALTIEDLASTNGVRLVRGDAGIEELQPNAPHELAPGDHLLLGDLEYVVEQTG